MSKYLLPELSVSMPAYNEEKNIQKTVEKAVKILKEITPKWEVLVVNDGSTDKTGKIVDQLVKKYKGKVRVTTHSPNKGYGGALKSCLYGCRYRWIVFTDADGQFDFSEIFHFIKIAKLKKADLVIGYRLQRQDPQMRILIAQLLKLWNFIFIGLGLKMPIVVLS